MIRPRRWRSLSWLSLGTNRARGASLEAAARLRLALRRLPELDTELIAAKRRRQQIDQMRDYYAQVARVDAVAYRIGVANRSACAERVTARIGLTAATVQSLPSKYRSAHSRGN